MIDFGPAFEALVGTIVVLAYALVLTAFGWWGEPLAYLPAALIVAYLCGRNHCAE